MQVTIITEDRNLVAEHVELKHPLAKGDIVIVTGMDYTGSYEVLRSQQTIVKVGSPKPGSVGKVVMTEIIVKVISS